MTQESSTDAEILSCDTVKEDSEEADDTIDVEDDPVPQPTFALMLASADCDFLKVSKQVESAVWWPRCAIGKTPTMNNT